MKKINLMKEIQKILFQTSIKMYNLQRKVDSDSREYQVLNTIIILFEQFNYTIEQLVEYISVIHSE